MKVTPERIEGACEECAFYNDCPYYYVCPPGKIIKFLQKEAQRGRIKILFREDLEKEMEEEE